MLALVTAVFEKNIVHFCDRMEGQVSNGELMSETEPRLVLFLLSSNCQSRM